MLLERVECFEYLHLLVRYAVEIVDDELVVLWCHTATRLWLLLL